MKLIKLLSIISCVALCGEIDANNVEITKLYNVNNHGHIGEHMLICDGKKCYTKTIYIKKHKRSKLK